MKRLRKFLRLSPRERSLLIKAAMLLWAIRLGLWLLPFRTLQGLLRRAMSLPAPCQDAANFSAEQIGRAIVLASRYVLEPTCLTQAFAAQVLLARCGLTACMHIGVAQAGAGRLEAHAWVECQGKVVIGGSQLESYTPLLAFQRENL